MPTGSELKLFVLAGESSGDRLGADLVRRLSQHRPVALTGVGGPELAAEGLKSLFPMENLAVMGFSDVLKRLPLLLWRIRQTADAIIRQRPDVAVLIDSQVFVKAVAKRVRKLAPQIPTVLYVAPTVWAWRPERAAQLKPLFDELLAILPFEPAVMAKLNGPPTHFVGHPAVERFPYRPAQPEQGPLLLLPGSRKGEVRRHLPLMRQAAEELANHPRITGVVIPTLPTLVDSLRSETATWPVPVQIVTGTEREPAFATAYAAFAVSGTVTFELAMSGVPMVVTYVADPHQARLYRKLRLNVDVALPNVVLGWRAVPEILFEETPAPRNLAPLHALLDDPKNIQAQRAAYDELRALMQKGAPEAPLVDAAERVLAVAQRSLIAT